jgi:hypothetical protein
MGFPRIRFKGYRRRNALLERGLELKDEKNKHIYQNLVYANLVHCDPPLTDDQVNTIYNMVFYHPDIYKGSIWKTKN